MTTKAIKETNFQTLLNRNAGDYYYVDPENTDLLKVMTKAEKLWYQIRGFFNKEHLKTTKKNVKRVIDAIPEQIYQTSLEEETINTLFLEKMSQLSQDIFDRKNIQNNEDLVRQLQNQVNREFPTLEEDREFEEKIKRARLSISLGLMPENGSGCSGSYIIPDLDGTRIGIFKPEDEDSLSLSNPSTTNKIKVFIGMIYDFLNLGSRYESTAGKSFLSEQAVFEADQIIGTNIVPKTTVINMSTSINTTPTRGSFQLFEVKRSDDESVEEATKALNVDKNFISTNANVQAPDIAPLLRKLAILHVVTGNMDGHAENVLFRKTNNIISEIIAIDGGICFSAKQAVHYLEKRHLYLFANLEQASQIGFKEDEEAKEIIEKLNTTEKKLDLAQKLLDIYKDHEDKTITNSRIIAMRYRIMLLNYIIEEEPDFKLSEFQNLKTKEELDQFMFLSRSLSIPTKIPL